MKKYVTLYNVIDIRTWQLHSIAIVEDKLVKYFKSVNEE